MRITKKYQSLNQQLHEENPHYGTSAPKYAETINSLVEELGAASILDYGCGKCLLRKSISPQYSNLVREYDPCIPEKSTRPSKADLLVSIDVLEHIEPDCLDDVLDDIYELSNKAVFLTVATRLAKKTLADGRNAHLLVYPPEWWLPKLCMRFSPRILHAGEGEFLFLGTPLEKENG